MYDNLKNLLSWLFLLGILEAFVGIIHLNVFPKYVGTDLEILATCELVAACIMVYWSFMMWWVLWDTPNSTR